MEEGNAIATEMKIINETINRMGGCVTTHACPQFGIVVQNVTTSSINIGGVTGGSARSLNNGQGVAIPLTFHSDGSFEGAGSGTDSGSARGVSPGETVGGGFGHAQDIAASGYIRAGNCGTQPCDVMHLVLAGGPNQQVTQMQARGQVNRDLNGTTTTNAAAVEFDLPAYVGGSAQKTFFSTPILNSYMTVNLVQGDNGTPALPAGSSLLYALRQCKPGVPASGGGSGAVGVVVPGLEGNSPPGAGKQSPTLSTLSTSVDAGLVIPGLDGLPSSKSGVQPPAIVAVTETIHVGETIPQPAAVNVQETVHVSDTVPQAAVVTVVEGVHVTDSAMQP